ncbi:4Fe-4S dicluster domain-containing protein [Desulfobacula phenolica]|uniref:Fe-S-cluster-containing dehydrogenase component n=1 Tax=Desulfobacula phenolica TaxID=90732 RepID=A0A1H2KAS0_9BACT|nr:(4Fe-4S)-binding protein [Desulfobacula phenolica]SDU65498.1 Fe-S-cluster-containing dehydrogenase component [Desulfobacula phenolica]
MKGGSKTKVIKEIKVDISKCTGCRSCEMACSAFHAVPRYSSLNPSRSRIRVYMDEVRDLYVPIRAGGYTQSECNGRNLYVINGKEYSECAFCPASCPSRDYFKEPDSGLPLKCDMCEDETSSSEPMCVVACKFDALTYEEREEPMQENEVPAIEKQVELKVAYESLVKKHGTKKLMETFFQLSKN